MLCVHSRLTVAAPHVFTYKEGVVSSDMEASRWMMLKSQTNTWTCVVADDLHILRSALDAQQSTYSALDRREDGSVYVGRTVETTRRIRVSGRVNARVHWEHSGDVQLIVESGAVVHFYAHGRDIRLVPVVRDRGRLVVIGRLAAISPTIDTTSHMDTTRLSCATGMRLGFRGKLTATPVETSRQRFVRSSISFPHAKSDCQPVKDDTPEEQQCKTCYKRLPNAVFSPCGHVYMCLVCAERHRRVAETNFCCPLCRTPIMHVTKDYL